MKKLKIPSQYNNIHLYVIGITLSLLIYKNIFFIILVILFLIKIKNNKSFKIIILLAFIFFIRGYFVKKESKININNKYVIAQVIEVKDNYTILKEKEKFIIYNTDYKPGDILNLYGEFKIIKSYNMPYIFNFKKYLENKDIYYSFNAYSINYVETKFNYRIINYNIKKYNEAHYTNYKYYNSIIFNDFSLDNKDDINRLGITHLFCISGLHISLIVVFLKKFIKKDLPIILVVFSYLILIGFSISLIRVFLLLILKYIRDYKKIYLSDLDLLSLIYLFLLLVRPKYLYDISFILTFLTTFSIYLTSNKKMIFVYIYFITLPISINLNNTINLIGIITNYIFIFIFEFLLLPATIISYFISNFEFVYSYIIYIFEFLIDIFDNNIFIIDVASLNDLEILLYYVSLYHLLRKNRLFLIFNLVFIFLKGNIIIGNHLYIMDVGQGDSSIIYSNNVSIMIDCYQKAYEYVYKRGIKEIDYLILTHNHNDHNGGVSNLMDHVKVNNIIVSYYDDSKYSHFKNVIKVKSGDIINTELIDIKILGPINKSSNTNNNSLVLSFELNNIKFLFTGDMEKEEEMDLINKYYFDLKADVLKVSHHGSNTSSTAEFIKAVSPKKAIISVGLDNKYGHPNKEVLNNLYGVDIIYTYEKSYYFGIYNLYKI